MTDETIEETTDTNISVFPIVTYHTVDGKEIPAIVAVTENKAILMRALLSAIEDIRTGNQSNKARLAGLKPVIKRYEQMLAEKPGDELPDDLKDF